MASQSAILKWEYDVLMKFVTDEAQLLPLGFM